MPSPRLAARTVIASEDIPELRVFARWADGLTTLERCAAHAADPRVARGDRDRDAVRMQDLLGAATLDEGVLVTALSGRHGAAIRDRLVAVAGEDLAFANPHHRPGGLTRPMGLVVSWAVAIPAMCRLPGILDRPDVLDDIAGRIAGRVAGDRLENSGTFEEIARAVEASPRFARLEPGLDRWFARRRRAIGRSLGKTGRNTPKGDVTSAVGWSAAPLAARLAAAGHPGGADWLARGIFDDIGDAGVGGVAAHGHPRRRTWIHACLTAVDRATGGPGVGVNDAPNVPCAGWVVADPARLARWRAAGWPMRILAAGATETLARAADTVDLRALAVLSRLAETGVVA